MTTHSMTVDQIDAKITAARQRLGELKDEARELSLPVASGDVDARSSLAQTNAETDRVLAELVILDQARGVALQQLATHNATALAGYRNQHLAIARDRAAAIVTLAARAEELIAEVKQVFTELNRTENDIRTALREAGTPASDVIVGQRGLAVFALSSLTAFINGSDRFSQPRSVAHIARAAWGDLLNGERRQAAHVPASSVSPDLSDASSTVADAQSDDASEIEPQEPIAKWGSRPPHPAPGVWPARSLGRATVDYDPLKGG